MKHEIVIDGWLPVSANELLRMHWGPRKKRLASDAAVVKCEAVNQRVPKAAGKRRVDITFFALPMGRLPDADNLLKSFLDSLVNAGMLLDDGPNYCELGAVRVVRGQKKKTVVCLTDMESESVCKTSK